LPNSWQREPNLYFRGNGSEIPFAGSYISKGKSQKTWELLLQRAKGRYLQLRLVFSGNGQQTPRISALRVYYPRFSYLNHYLPSIYREDEQSAFFLDRFLANFEGFYTTIEDKIAAVQMLFDVQSAPPDALDWLASWFGVVLDPAWTEDKRRLFIRYAVEFFQYRGTTRGLRIALRLVLDSNADERIFERQTAQEKIHDPIRIVERFLTRRTPEIIPADSIAEQNLPRITRQTDKWQPKQGADVLHRLYRVKFAQKLIQELSLTELRGLPPTAVLEKFQEILNQIAAAIKDDEAKKKELERIPNLTFPLTKPDDAEDADIWERFALETLGFVPSDAAAREGKSWQNFLRGEYKNNIADLNKAHGTNYPNVNGEDGFKYIFLPRGTETNANLQKDWKDFVDGTGAASRNRKLWQDFLARRYRRIGQLNEFYGTSWRSFDLISLFDQLPLPDKPLADWSQLEGVVLAMHRTAHRFTVLIPATLNGNRIETAAEQNRKLALVRRVVALEKPAHTICDFRYYWNLFRLEEVRLGLDTLLGLGSRDPQLNPALVIGEGYVGESRLGLPQPEKYSSRYVLGSESLEKQKKKKDEEL
jgi:phage tail-like protein